MAERSHQSFFMYRACPQHKIRAASIMLTALKIGWCVVMPGVLFLSELAYCARASIS